jgi:hypothetical protein
MPVCSFQIARDAFGRLIVTDAGGQVTVGVVPVRAFPLAAPDDGIALVGGDGHEVVWIDRLTDLPEQVRALIEGELASRDFMPEIRKIVSVSGFATPSTWQVVTDRGDAVLVLKGEEDIRRLAGSALVVGDSNGIHFLVRDTQALDKASRRILDRFL